MLLYDISRHLSRCYGENHLFLMANIGWSETYGGNLFVTASNLPWKSEEALPQLSFKRPSVFIHQLNGSLSPHAAPEDSLLRRGRSVSVRAGRSSASSS